MDAEDFQQNNEHGGYPIVVLGSRSMLVRTALILAPVGAVVVLVMWVLKLAGWIDL